MNISFTTSDKKRNSTKVINTYSKTLANVKLKENTNLTFPIFSISRTALEITAFLPQYNYIKLVESTITYYYFIDEWEAGNNGTWLIHCTMDVLATFKTDILSKTLYVLRSSQDYDLQVIDNLYPTISKIEHYESNNVGNVTIRSIYSGETTTVSAAAYFLRPFSQGYYYLKIVGNGGASIGGYNLVVMSYYGFKEFINNIFTVDKSQKFPDIAEGVANGIANLSQYIISCTWLPFINPDHTLQSITISLGGYDVSCPAGKIITTTLLGTRIHFTIDLPSQHPQASTRGYFLNAEPYSKRTLFLYPFGIYDLSSPSLANLNISAIEVYIEVDEYSGESMLSIYCNSNLLKEMCLLVTDTKNYGVDIPLTTSSLTLLGAVGSLIQASTGNTTSYRPTTFSEGVAMMFLESADTEYGSHLADDYAKGRKTTTTGIGSLLRASGTEIKTNGTLGAILPYQIKPHIEADYSFITNDNYDHEGRPLCADRLLSTLSGYVLCKDSDIGIDACTTAQLQMIVTYLTSGFFIE